MRVLRTFYVQIWQADCKHNSACFAARLRLFVGLLLCSNAVVVIRVFVQLCLSLPTFDDSRNGEASVATVFGMCAVFGMRSVFSLNKNDYFLFLLLLFAPC
jgi:hypothetical protein